MRQVTPNVPIKPCPFCGNDDIKFDEHDSQPSPTGKLFTMCCYKCSATFRNTYKLDLLVESWNKRV